MKTASLSGQGLRHWLATGQKIPALPVKIDTPDERAAADAFLLRDIAQYAHALLVAVTAGVPSDERKQAADALRERVQWRHDALTQVRAQPGTGVSGDLCPQVPPRRGHSGTPDPPRPGRYGSGEEPS